MKKSPAACLGAWLCAGFVARSIAEEAPDSSGVSGGLVVHVGCSDGQQTVALRVDEKYLVQGLDTDPANAQAAREYAISRGPYGQVSFDVFDGTHLPYIDNLVNLLVVEDPCDVSGSEIFRVLVPGGVARI